MGQSVAVDRQPGDLKELLQVQDQMARGAWPAEIPDRHHVKMWSFEKRDGVFSSAPVHLYDDQGFSKVDFSRSNSYLLLHIHSTAVPEASPGSAILLQDVAARVGVACTPRGLAIEVVSRAQAVPGSSMTLHCSIFVWHGQEVDPIVKARVFTKAFELERTLRLSASWQALARSVQDGTILRGKSNPDALTSEAAADKLRQSRNRLLISLLEGQSRPSSSASNAPSSQRFPRLGLSVRQSLGLATTSQAWEQSSDSAQSLHTRPSATRPVVPKLAMGGLGLSLQGRGDKSTDAEDANGRERHRVAADQAAPSSAQPSRPVVPLLGLKNIRSEADSQASTALPSATASMPSRPGTAPVRAGRVPALNLGGVPEDAGDAPPLLSTSKPCNAQGRLEPPVMLNFEEINLSEEELMKMYDPNTVENNYHLPHHVYRHMQLERHKMVCSEVIPGALFISGYVVAGDLAALQKHNITHIVNCAGDVCESRFPNDFTYCTYYLKDTNGEDISVLFYRTIEWVHNAISQGGRVLIHCHKGVSRSATMVLAYTMWRYQIPFETAHERLRKARGICDPNTGFTCQLLLLGKKIGIGGQVALPPPDALHVFRVAPHDPRAPFLLLVPVPDWSPVGSTFDPRFGWVVQRGSSYILWLGGQCSDSEGTTQTVQQHIGWAETFERCRPTMTVVHEGHEPAHFWLALGIHDSPADGAFTAVSGAFDADAEAMLRARQAPEPSIAKEL